MGACSGGYTDLRLPEQASKFFGLDALAGTPHDGITRELDFNLLVGWPPHAAFRLQYRFFACVRFSQNSNDLLEVHSNFDLIIIFSVDLAASGEREYRKYAYRQHQQLYRRYNSFHLSLFISCIF